jgi:hypothetical protein
VIAWDSSGAKVGSSVTSLTVDITAAAVGAVCYAAAEIATTQPSGTTMTGWTRLLDADEGSSSHYAVWRRTKISGDTTFTISWANSQGASAVWSSYTGLAATPDEGSAALAHTASSTSFTTPSATPSDAARWALVGAGVRVSAAGETFTAPSGFTARVQAGSTVSRWAIAIVSDSAAAVTAAAHSYTCVLSTAETHGAAWILYLIPASGSTTYTLTTTITVATAVAASRSAQRAAQASVTTAASSTRALQRTSTASATAGAAAARSIGRTSSAPVLTAVAGSRTLARTSTLATAAAGAAQRLIGRATPVQSATQITAARAVSRTASAAVTTNAAAQRAIQRTDGAPVATAVRSSRTVTRSAALAVTTAAAAQRLIRRLTAALAATAVRQSSTRPGAPVQPVAITRVRALADWRARPIETWSAREAAAAWTAGEGEHDR